MLFFLKIKSCTIPLFTYFDESIKVLSYESAIKRNAKGYTRIFQKLLLVYPILLNI